MGVIAVGIILWRTGMIARIVDSLRTSIQAKSNPARAGPKALWIILTVAVFILFCSPALAQGGGQEGNPGLLSMIPLGLADFTEMLVRSPPALIAVTILIAVAFLINFSSPYWHFYENKN